MHFRLWISWRLSCKRFSPCPAHTCRQLRQCLDDLEPATILAWLRLVLLGRRQVRGTFQIMAACRLLIKHVKVRGGTCAYIWGAQGCRS